MSVTDVMCSDGENPILQLTTGSDVFGSTLSSIDMFTAQNSLGINGDIF